MRSANLFYRFFALLLVTSLLAAPATPTTFAASTTAKTVAVYLPAGTQARVAAVGAVTVLDYGSFVWAELPRTQLATLTARGLKYQVAATTIGVYGYQFDPRNDGAPALPTGWQAAPTGDQPSLRLVQFAGPSQDAWLASAEAAGLKVLQYYAHNAYLVWGTAVQVDQLTQTAPVRWQGVFQPAYKLNPSLQARTGRLENVAITFYNGGLVKQTLTQIQALGGGYLQHYAAQPDEAFYTAIFTLEVAQLAAVAALPNVWAIDYSSARPGFDDENGDQIVAGNYTSPTNVPGGYYAWLTQKGVNGNGVQWADVDTGLDSTHPDITGRAVAFVSYAGAPAANTDSDGHGSHTAGTIFGDGRGGTGIVDPNGFYWGTGMAPSSTLVVQNALMGSSWPPAGGWNILSRDTVLNNAIGSNNSWFTGASGAQGYSAAAREHDLMVRDAVFTTTTIAEPIIMVFSAGNAGSGASTMTEPKEAKNLISVGNSMNYPRTGTNINGLATSSSRGPALDGRTLPNVVAPGSQTVSFKSATGGASCTTAVAGSGAPRYSYCTGTSMAAPFTSGSTVLLTDWWRQAGRGTPSPAMTKALLINGAADMVGGTGVNGNIPNNNQGWGRVNLNNVIRTGVPSLYYDQSNLFDSTGQQFLLALRRADPTKPVKISLVWSDAAGGTGANPALVNNLDLSVMVGGNLYLGNVFNTGWSATGGTADTLNNIENVYLQNPNPDDTINLTINATNIAGDGVPYNGDATDQDYALVIYNAVPAASAGTLTGRVTNAATLAPLANAMVQITAGPTQTFGVQTNASGWYTATFAASTYTLTATATNYETMTVPGVSVTLGSTTTQDFALTPLAVLNTTNYALYQAAGNGNGFVDPGETFTMHIGLRNSGILTATNVNGTLSLLTGNGTVLSGTAAYSNIAPGATTTNTTPFRFQVSPAQVCGQPLTFGFNATYNTSYQTSYGLSVPVGSTQLGVTQTFTSTNVPLAIPDNNAAGITSTLAVATSGVVGDIDVRLNGVTHPFVGNLTMRLVSPQGTSITLMSSPGTGSTGSSGDNFTNTILDDGAAATIESIGATGPFTGRWRPDQLLSRVNTQPLSGTWRLQVADNVSTNTGTLNAWSVDVRELLYICDPYTAPTYGVAAQALQDTQAQYVGQSLTYAVLVTNTGNITDTFNVALSGQLWNTTAPATVGPLAPGASTQVSITVTVPLTAAHNALDMVMVNFASTGNTNISTEVMLMTTAIWYRNYLPFIQK